VQSSVAEAVEGRRGNGGLSSWSWGSRQTYRYEATDGSGCYFRNVTSSGYSIASDQSNEVCAGVGQLAA
jgi:hypothetical protein